jgi:hypothetical protein
MNDPIAQRITQAVGHFGGRPGLGLRQAADLESLLRAELPPHGAAFLRQPCLLEGSYRQALPPRRIYHVLAGNLGVSAEASLLFGFLLGAELIFKLPSCGLPGFIELASLFPNVQCLTTHDPALMNSCDAVVAFGSDESVAAVRAQLIGTPRFLAYGTKISLGWIPPGAATPEHAARAAVEIVAFQQLGCLSPQAYLCADSHDAGRFARLLADALGTQADPAPPASALPAIRDYRLRAHARGDQVWEITPTPGPTVVLRSQGPIEPGPGFGCIDVIPAPDPAALLRPWQGRLSTLSVAAPSIPPALWDLARSCRISRLCPIGQAQNPPLLWLHDGRPRLADLLLWIAADPGLAAS